MSQADAVKAHKLSQGMVDALSRATFREHATGNGEAGYVVHDMHPRTRKALHDRGLMYGHYYLTRTGVEVLATLAGNTVDVRGYVWEGDKLLVAPYVETYADDVTVTDMPTAPEFDAPGAAECFFGCGSPVVAVFVDYVGRTEGLCATHRDRVEGETYSVPATPQNGSEDVQEESNMDNDVIIPGVHSLDMGSKGYNRFVGIGESSSVPGSLYTYGLATAISRHPGMNGTGHEDVTTEFGDVITVRTSIGDRRYVVQDNRYSATGPRKGDPILTPYETDDVRCYVCQCHGDNSIPGRNIDGEWVCGFCAENNCTPEKLNSHSLTFYVETESAGVKYNCESCGAINTRSRFSQFECDNEIEDAGFVETESVDDYATVSALTTGAGFHTVDDSRNATPEAPVTTGTTTHTLDTDGSEWVRFDHVLSVGDVVKVVGMQGVYEVHCLIPGLPVVYVLGTTGEPFPVPASKVYAL